MDKKFIGLLSIFFLGSVLFGCNNGTIPDSSEGSSNDSSSTTSNNEVSIPEGMVAVNFRNNYKKDSIFKVVAYNPGDKITEIEELPKRSNHKFTGWYEDPYCLRKFDFDNTRVPDNGIDIYAGWLVSAGLDLKDNDIEDYYEEKMYSITYTNGGGFSYINPDGRLVMSADAGDVIKFKLAIGKDYEGTPVVKANDEILTASQGIYSYVVSGNTIFTVSGLTKDPSGDDEKNLVSWYFCGEGSLWDSNGWSTEGGLQLYENPDNPEDKGQYLGIKFEVGDTFKVTDGTTWYGYEMMDTWEDPANAGLSHFAPKSDGYGGNNIQCIISGTFDVYVNGSGKLWIQLSAN